MALWLLATLDGIGSAREVGRRCETDIPYMWICGGVGVNYHTISDFRTQHVEFLERILVDSVAAMIDSGLVTLDVIAQDGMRVRANAGKSSFRRRPTLEQLQQEAERHLEKLNQENQSEAEREQANARRTAAAERAAQERKERIDEALKQHEELAKQREQRKKGTGKETRVSTTDPDARKMKMANGGFDPAFNVQFATDAETRVIVGVEVTNEGTDGGQLEPMHNKVCESYGKSPQKIVADSAYATKEGVTAVELKETEVVSTVPRAEQLEKPARCERSHPIDLIHRSSSSSANLRRFCMYRRCAPSDSRLKSRTSSSGTSSRSSATTCRSKSTTWPRDGIGSSARSRWNASPTPRRLVTG